ncbi:MULTISPECIES: CBS domain-containing protein [Mesonia]|uniref:Inosine-5'-monophosphate dehydrogenase n=1 Tax=Mesonia oceanica TaxID=2687242 RepID=A0AC61Y3Q9_9FLAO|nr:MULTISPECIES: CBS domain-containing protein [Mesonia]MAN26891.1 inosine-5-monophosphate dehydrogenase [Mesonia sp.]MAQ41697.1 inosine-5-monophosphate dehydrogenase [Mesonia sp.]MBJ96563.1 inosine-5-monophosphate dehydrogenase [Flavobacteriaceae bacterium]VVU99111.1 Inosine-5'-monophosphate dehydrogenase [Mesonia oceanica]|tara:strand:- start:418 stop:882 length:465 start_codon:yes stop_codon:yes gene_type:complete
MGIKNFQGKQIGVIATSENITVEDFMTVNMYKFYAGQSVLEVMETLLKYRISGGPVVNQQNELIGIISEGDCIKQISESRYYNQPMENMTVENYMAKEVETVSPDMHLFDVANKFLSLKKRRFPVCEQGKLIGLISQKDVLKAALEIQGYNWKS